MYPAGYTVIFLNVLPGVVITVKAHCVQSKSYNSLFLNAGYYDDRELVDARSVVRRCAPQVA